MGSAGQSRGMLPTDGSVWHDRYDLQSYFSADSRYRAFLINPYGLLYTQITASTLIKVNLNGTIISKSDDAYSVNMGALLFTALSMQRDLMCIASSTPIRVRAWQFRR